MTRPAGIPFGRNTGKNPITFQLTVWLPDQQLELTIQLRACHINEARDRVYRALGAAVSIVNTTIFLGRSTSADAISKGDVFMPVPRPALAIPASATAHRLTRPAARTPLGSINAQ